MKGRLLEFDIAKGIAILSVILGHMGNINVDRVVYVFHMPLFFLISGYFLSSKDIYISFVKRKFKSLIIPYLFSCLLIIIGFLVAYYVWGYEARRGLVGWILAALYGAGAPMNYPLDNIGYIGAIWFLLALFWALCIVRYLLPYKDNFALIIVCLLSYVGYATATTIWLPFSLQAGLFATFYVYLGVLSRRFVLFSKGVPHPIVYLFLSLIVVWDVVYYRGLYMSYCYLGNGFMDIVASLCACYLLLSVCCKMKSIPVLSSILVFYGKNSLIILSIHIVEQSIIPWRAILQEMLPNISGVQIFSLIVFFKIFLVTSLAFVFLKIPVLRRIYQGNVCVSVK